MHYFAANVLMTCSPKWFAVLRGRRDRSHLRLVASRLPPLMRLFPYAVQRLLQTTRCAFSRCSGADFLVCTQRSFLKPSKLRLGNRWRVALNC